MKSMLYQAVEAAPAVESVEEDILKRHFANFDESFFNYCDKELKKINTFYSEKLAEATRKFATLNNELKIALESVQKGKTKAHQSLKKRTLPYRKIQVCTLGISVASANLTFSAFFLPNRSSSLHFLNFIFR
jgi:xenotropic and polytropic retrovirus receptor 1